MAGALKLLWLLHRPRIPTKRKAMPSRPPHTSCDRADAKSFRLQSLQGKTRVKIAALDSRKRRCGSLDDMDANALLGKRMRRSSDELGSVVCEKGSHSVLELRKAGKCAPQDVGASEVKDVDVGHRRLIKRKREFRNGSQVERELCQSKERDSISILSSGLCREAASLATLSSAEKQNDRVANDNSRCDPFSEKSNDHELTISYFELLQALRNRDLPQSRKIELAWRFTASHCPQVKECSEGKSLPVKEWVSLSQFVSFLCDWIQSALIASAKDRSLDEKARQERDASALLQSNTSVAHLDKRYWAVLKWCLLSGYTHKAGLISSSLLQPITSVLSTLGRIFSNWAAGDILGSHFTGAEGNGLLCSEMPSCIHHTDTKSKQVLMPGFLEVLTEVVRLLLFAHERVFRPNLSLWILLASASFNLANFLFNEDSKEVFMDQVVLLWRLVFTIAEAFARFVRSYPNPRKIFEAVVSRLLEPLFCILENLNETDEKEAVHARERNRLFKAVEDILKHSLFHAAHLKGYLDTCKMACQNEGYQSKLVNCKKSKSSNYSEAGFLCGSLLSYHKLLFQQLEYFQQQNRAVVLGALGWLLRTFIQEMESHRVATAVVVSSVKGKRAWQSLVASQSGTSKGEDLPLQSRKEVLKNDSTSFLAWTNESTKVSNQSYFFFFAELTLPLMKNLREDLECLYCGDFASRLLHMTSLISVIKKLLAVARDDHLYVPTEDTNMQSHLNLIRDIYSIVTNLGIVALELCSKFINESDVVRSKEKEKAKFAINKEEDLSNLLSVLSRDVVRSIGYLLELDHRIVENSFTDVWFIVLSTISVQCILQECCQCDYDLQGVAREAGLLGSRVIEIFNELRQVDCPLFDLCRMLRFFMQADEMNCIDKPVAAEHVKAKMSSIRASLPAKHFAEAIDLVFCSPQFLKTIGMAMQCLPEGQLASFVVFLSEDAQCTLKCLQRVGRYSTQIDTFLLRSAGNSLMELYTIMLDYSNVTSTNSVQVGKAVRDLVIDGLSPLLCMLVDECASGGNDLISSFYLRALKGIADSGKGKYVKKKLKLDTDDMHRCEALWSVACSVIVSLILRLYMSARSLHRECIVLMPPRRAIKASMAANDLGMVCFTTDWMQLEPILSNEGFFSFIGRGSVSAYIVLTKVEKIFGRKGNKEAPVLSYTLRCIALQSLFDRNNQIKAVKFLLDEAELRSSQTLLSDHVKDVTEDMTEEVLIPYHSSQGKRECNYKDLRKLLKVLRQDASSLVSFMVGKFSHLDEISDRSKEGSSHEEMEMHRHEIGRTNSDEDNWDMVVSSLKKKSLPTARWHLLCQNIDVWSDYACENDLKKFIGILLGKTLQCKCHQIQSGDHSEIKENYTVLHITKKLLNDIGFYEEKALRIAFVTSLCHELEAVPCSVYGDITAHIEVIEYQVGVIGGMSCLSSGDMGFRMKKTPKMCTKLLTNSKIMGFTTIEEQITKLADDECQGFLEEVFDFDRWINILNMISWLPKGYVDASSAVTYVYGIVRLERFIIMRLMKLWSSSRSAEAQTGVGSSEMLELLQGLLTCRRALEALVALDDLDLSGSSVILALLRKSAFLYWSLLSIHVAATCIFDFGSQVGDSIVTAGKNSLCSIVQSTTGLFTFVSEGLMAICLKPLLTLLEDTSGVTALNEDQPCKLQYLSQELQYLPALENITNNLGNQMKNTVDYAKGLNLEYFVKLPDVSVLIHDNSERNLQSEGRLEKDLYGIFASVAATGSFLWSITTVLESLDQQCHLDKTGSTKWLAELPCPLMSFVNDMELLLMSVMQELLLWNESEKIISNNGCECSCITEREHRMTITDEAIYDTAEESSGLIAATKCYERRNGVIEENEEHDDDGDSDEGDEHKVGGDSTYDNEKPNDLASERRKGKTVFEKVTCRAHSCSELLEISYLQKSVLRHMLLGELTKQARLLGEVYMAMAAIVRLKSLFSSPNVINKGSTFFNLSWTVPMSLHVGAAYWLMLEATTLAQPSVSCSWLLGIVKYMESVGSLLPYLRPALSSAAFMKVIDVHMAILAALMPFSEFPKKNIESPSRLRTSFGVSKTSSELLSFQELTPDIKVADELVVAIRNSLITLLRKSLGSHFRLALQAVERSLLGFEGSSAIRHGLQIDSLAENKVRTPLAAGIECLSLCLDAVSGPKRLRLLSKYSSKFLAAILHLITFCQGIWLPCKGVCQHVSPVPHCKKDFDTNTVNSVPVILKCVEILGNVASREAIFPMKPSHVAQAMHCPVNLFKPFYQWKVPQFSLIQSLSAAGERVNLSECQLNFCKDNDEFFLRLYISCCNLLRNLLRHRKRESGHCVAFLEESLRTLLFCLEAIKWRRSGNQSAVAREDAVHCAGWLRRLYEEVAEQKEILGTYCKYILSDYICVISGYGLTTWGLDREVDKALRPGAYALVDSCSADDLQQLHAVLGEGPRRNALLTLRCDYEQHYKYTGKV